MASGTRIVHKAILQRWNARELSVHFPGGVYYNEVVPESSNIGVWPYCVIEHGLVTTTSRHSDIDKLKVAEIREIDWQFRVHAQSMKDAADKIDLIMDVFDNYAATMDAGCLVQMVPDADFPVREGDSEYMWVVRYRVIFTRSILETPN